MSNQFWMIWPGNAVASALILFAIVMPFLYAARKLVHDLLHSVGRMVGGPLRLGARWLFATARDMKERNKAVLLAHGREEVSQHIEREFERVGALVTRDLEGYPALQRKLLDEITRVEEDYKKCGEVPPASPEWSTPSPRSRRSSPTATRWCRGSSRRSSARSTASTTRRSPSTAAPSSRGTRY